MTEVLQLLGARQAHFHLPFFNVCEGNAHSWPDVQPEDCINDQHQPQPVHNIRPVIPQNTQPTLPQRQSPPTPSTAKDDHMIKILENQSSLTRILVKQQLLATLPQGNIPPFWSTSPLFTPLNIVLKAKQTTTETGCSSLYSLQEAKLNG